MKGVLDSIELRMLRRADYLPTQLPTHLLVLTAFRSCEHVTLEGCCALSYSLLSLAFATRWNPKHPSYVSTRLFCNSARMFLFCFFHWPRILNVRAFSTGLLMFSVLPSTYSIIYSEKYALYLGKF